jgi:SagB-type dehydrogenase family enzyme
MTISHELDVAGSSLPPPTTVGGMPLHEVLHRRRSQRDFSRRPLSTREVGQLCWAAQGITSPDGLRTTPSAGALFGLVLRVVDAEGLFEYQPASHALQCLATGDIRPQLQVAALDQACVGSAPVCIAISIDVGRIASKYERRAERYCLLEAGHAAQNILLQATALGLAGVPVGAFRDGAVAAALQLPPRLRPVYLLPVGHIGEAQKE